MGSTHRVEAKQSPLLTLRTAGGCVRAPSAAWREGCPPRHGWPAGGRGTGGQVKEVASQWGRGLEGGEPSVLAQATADVERAPGGAPLPEAWRCPAREPWHSSRRMGSPTSVAGLSQSSCEDETRARCSRARCRAAHEPRIGCLNRVGQAAPVVTGAEESCKELSRQARARSCWGARNACPVACSANMNNAAAWGACAMSASLPPARRVVAQAPRRAAPHPTCRQLCSKVAFLWASMVGADGKYGGGSPSLEQAPPASADLPQRRGRGRDSASRRCDAVARTGWAVRSLCLAVLYT